MLSDEICQKLREAGLGERWSPILEELIEMCGNQFYQLKRQCNNGHCWFKAESNKKVKSLDCHYEDEEYLSYKAEAPDIAVAKLLLKIKKHET